MDREREQTGIEELANSVSHGMGLGAALVALPVLIAVTQRTGPVRHVAGASVYAVTLVLVYLSSMLYHAMPMGRIKRLLMRLDHVAIFLFMAGSYTPFALRAPAGSEGWTLFGLVWGLAVIGAVLKACDRLRHPLWSTALYVAMGWLVLAAAWPLLQQVPLPGVAWILGGGAAYTVGVVFFLLDSRLLFGHLFWHLCVLAGSVCHFLAVLWYSA